MKIAHMSDLHYSPATLVEVDRCFAFAIERASAAGAEVAVISGDATDHRLDVHSPAVIALARRVRELSDQCPVLMLQGTYSHEPPGTLDIFRLIGGSHPVFVADRICQVALTAAGTWQASAGWAFEPGELAAGARVVFSCLPSVNKAQVAAVVGTLAAADAVGDQVAALLSAWGPINLRFASEGVPTVGLSHGTLSGCLTEHGVPMAGLDHEFTSGSLFAALASAFLLGHIHMHQSWYTDADTRAIAYPGSIGRLHYGEEDLKGFLLWNVKPHDAQFQFVPTPARRMLHLDFPGTPDMDALEVASRTAEGAFVRVRWQVDAEHAHAIDRQAIEALFATAEQVKLEGRVLPVVRTRAEGMNGCPGVHDKLAKWCAVTATPPAGLDERLGALLAKDPEAIAAEALA